MRKRMHPVIEMYRRRQRNMSRRLLKIAQIIESVERRCIAADGPVSKTLEEMTDLEMRKIYRLATRPNA